MAVISRTRASSVSSRRMSRSIRSRNRAPILGALGVGEDFGRRPDRRKRIAELVQHVGGEALGELDVRIEAPP